MYNKSTFLTLDDEFKFGKHQGTTLKDVIELYPDYLVWCLKNLNHLWMSSDLIEEIRNIFPDFPGNDLLDQHGMFESDFDEEDDDRYYSRNYGSCYERQHYEEYAGTYVQEVMGWSDEMIDDALDGEPDAYWNID